MPISPGAPKGNRNRQKHGLRTQTRSHQDLRRAVDKRVAATMRTWEEALGARLSPQRAMIIANIGRKLRDLAKMETYELKLEQERGTMFNRRRHSPLPISEAKWKLLDMIDRALERIGLDVTPKAATSLEDVIASFSKPREIETDTKPEPES
jgi:hypothetical protein